MMHSHLTTFYSLSLDALDLKKCENLFLIVHLIQLIQRFMRARRLLFSLQYTKMHGFNPTPPKK